MSQYDFDTPIERYGTDSLKFDYATSKGKSPDLLPLWVADMDFALPEEITDIFAERMRHGIFGYTEPGDDYYAAVNSWFRSHYGWEAPWEWFCHTPGVVFALAMAVRSFTEPGDAVLIQQPVYFHFSNEVINNGRRVANAPLVYRDGVYSIDFEAFERTLVESNAKLFLLCNPHNPVGRVWTEDELRRMIDICLKHHVIVASDEIHMDFARPGFTHTSVMDLGDDVLQHCAVLTSAAKTFNLAGLQASNIIIPNPELRERFSKEVSSCGYGHLGTMGLLATRVCYERGARWAAELKEYLEGNWQLLAEHLSQHAPLLYLVPAESTYLAWIDCRAYGMYGQELERFIEDKAGLWLDCGHMFGPDGDGFIRINIATQRAYLQKALTQLTDAFAPLSS